MKLLITVMRPGCHGVMGWEAEIRVGPMATVSVDALLYILG